MSRFREKLNQSFCLVKVESEGWCLGKKTQKRIFITASDGTIRNICTTDDMEQYRNFSESIEYESDINLSAGQKVVLDSFDPYFVIDSGYRGEDGRVKYLIAR